MMQDYWNRILYPESKNSESVDELIGNLASLHHILSSRKDCSSAILYDIVVYQGDLLRYKQDSLGATQLYNRAISMDPSQGHSYNQLAALGIDQFRNLLMALAVVTPWSPARDNLRKLLPSMGSDPVLKSLCFALSDRLGKKKSNWRKCTDFEKSEHIEYIWLAVAADPTCLDSEEMLGHLELFFEALRYGIGNNSDWIYPALQWINTGHFVNKTKRFSHWDPLIEAIAKFCNSNAPSEDVGLLPEDAPYKGMKCFADLSQSYDPTKTRTGRMFTLARQLERHKLVTLDKTGRWCTKADLIRQAQQSKTSLLLARKRLQDQVGQLESKLGCLIDTKSWYIPDDQWLLKNWHGTVIPEAEAHSMKFLITLPVLSELDFLKANSQLARTIINHLNDAILDGDPSFRLQKPNEKIPQLRFGGLGPREAHRLEFVEAVSFFAKDTDNQYLVLSDDPDTIKATSPYLKRALL